MHLRHLTAPFAQGSLSECSFLDLTIYKIIKKAHKNVYLRKARNKKLFSESKEHRKPRQIVKPSATLFLKNRLETKIQGICEDDC